MATYVKLFKLHYEVHNIIIYALDSKKLRQDQEHLKHIRPNLIHPIHSNAVSYIRIGYDMFWDRRLHK